MISEGEGRRSTMRFQKGKRKKRYHKPDYTERSIRAAQAAWIDKKLGYEILVSVYNERLVEKK